MAVSSGTDSGPPVWRAPNGITTVIWGEVYTDRPLQGTSAAKYVGQCFSRKRFEDFSQLEGAYVIVMYEEASRCLYIINDPAGLRPFFYSRTDRAWSFSSFPSSLRDNRAQLDPVGLSCFLANGVFLGDRTHWKGVKKLEPGTACTIDARGADFHRYWDYQFAKKIPKPRKSKLERLKQLDRAVANSVHQRVDEGQPVALLLTGGHDSLGILGYIRESAKDTSHVTAFTWSDMAPDSSNDAGIAKSSSAIAGIRHNLLRFDHSNLESSLRENVQLTEGLSDAAAYHHSELSLIRKIRNDFGNEALIQGDQAFGFYRSVRGETDLFNGLDLRPLCEMSGLLSLLNPSIREEWATASREQFDKFNQDCPYTKLNDKKDYFYFNLRQQGFQNACRRLRLSAISEHNPLLGAKVLNEAVGQYPCDRINKSLWKELVEQKFPDLVRSGIARRDGMKPWAQVFRDDDATRSTLRQHLVDEPGILAEYFSVDDLRSWAVVLLENSLNTDQQPSRNFIRRSLSKVGPLKAVVLRAHRTRKRIAGDKYLEPPDERLALRILLYKFWLERYASFSN
ncbi:asparagine synthase-related protein [Pseudomonadota bacterium]